MRSRRAELRPTPAEPTIAPSGADTRGGVEGLVTFRPVAVMSAVMSNERKQASTVSTQLLVEILNVFVAGAALSGAAKFQIRRGTC